MSEKTPKSKFKWVEKLKSIKHIEIYITIIFAIILILIFFSSTGSNKSSVSNITSKTTTQDTTITTYVSDMEQRLEQILSQVQGASNVKVMLTLDMTNTTIKDNVIEVADFPEVKGVVIVAKGVENTGVKMNILKAVQAVIDISSGRIEILSSN
ncbi:MAG: hypothetical protein IJ458_03380 [Clostridia bacterium]|nr:hypothetical protein [Clostridia bacterium]